jgi:GxxExxY protein
MTQKPFEATGDPQTAAIIAAAIEVHRVLGCGFVERVYRRPLAFELTEREIPFESEVVFPIEYKGRRTGVVYRLDFVCFGEVVVELKALREISGLEMAQTLNYLRASGLKRALILNFGSSKLQVKRLLSGDGAPDIKRLHTDDATR